MTQEELTASLDEPNRIVKGEKYEEYIYDNRKAKIYYFRDGILKEAK